MSLPDWIKSALAAVDVPPRSGGYAPILPRVMTTPGRPNRLPRVMTTPARKETTMDPDACLERLLDAVETLDREEAVDAAQDFLEWMARGGAPPTVTTEGGVRLAVDLASMVTRCWTREDADQA